MHIHMRVQNFFSLV